MSDENITEDSKEASIQFQKAPVPDRLRITLTEEKKRELIAFMDEKKSQIEQSRNDFKDRQRVYLPSWDDFVTSTRKGSWDNASNLHMPLTYLVHKSLHARFYEIFTNLTTVQFIPRETMDSEYTALFAHLFKWFAFDYVNGYRGIKGFIREIFYDATTVGFGIGIKDWQLKQRKIITIEAKQLEELQKEMQDLMPQVNELAKQKQGLETDEEMATKVIDISPYKEAQKVITVYEGTRLRSVPWEDAYFPNDLEESNDLDSCPYAMVRSQVSRGTLNLKVAQGIYNKEAVKRVTDKTDTQLGTQATEVKQERERLSGISEIHLDNGKYGISQNFVSFDIDGDGIDEELVIVSHEKEILHINYLDRISTIGSRPILKFDCFTKPRQSYSRGVPEFMYPLNTEVDILHNKRIDMVTIQTTPFGVYKAGSSLKKQPIRIAPGKLIPVDETTDIRLLSWGSSASPLAAEEQMLFSLGERLASVSAYNQGVTPENVGPTRSTSGLLTVLKQADKEFLSSVEHNAGTFRKMVVMMMSDLDFRIAPDVKLRILGSMVDDSSKIIKNYGQEAAATVLRVAGQFDIRVDVASAVTSEEVRRNEAQLTLQTLVTPSLAQQLGIIGPKAIFQAYKNWLYAYGHNPKDFLKEPQYTDEPLTLFQELQICGQGEIPPMAMKDDHQAKAQQLMAASQTPEFQEPVTRGIFVQNFVQIVAKAAQKHMMLAQMLEPKGLPNPTGQSGQEGQALAGVAPQQGSGQPGKTTARQDTGVKEQSGAGQET